MVLVVNPCKSRSIISSLPSNYKSTQGNPARKMNLRIIVTVTLQSENEEHRARKQANYSPLIKTALLYPLCELWLELAILSP